MREVGRRRFQATDGGRIPWTMDGNERERESAWWCATDAREERKEDGSGGCVSGDGDGGARLVTGDRRTPRVERQR